MLHVVGFDEARRLGIYSTACMDVLKRYWDSAFTRAQLAKVCELYQIEHAPTARKAVIISSLMQSEARPIGSDDLDRGVIPPSTPERKVAGAVAGAQAELPVQGVVPPRVAQPLHADQPMQGALPIEVKNADGGAGIGGLVGNQAAPTMDEQLRGAMATNAALMAHITELQRSAHRPSKASTERERIVRGEFEELHKYLHRKRTGSRELCERDDAVFIGAVSLTVNGTGRAPKIKTITDWLEAWSYYQADFCSVHLHRLQDLHEHLRWMVKAPYPDEEKLAYDRALRLRHVGPDAKWGVLDMRLFSYHVGHHVGHSTGAKESRRQQHRRPSVSTRPNAPKKRKAKLLTCDNFSSTGRCAYGAQCRYKHMCSICQGDHFWRDCPTGRSAFSPNRSR